VRFRAIGRVTLVKKFDLTFECEDIEDAFSEAEGAVEQDTYFCDANIDNIEIESCEPLTSDAEGVESTR
jgi:hypothetical protein